MGNHSSSIDSDDIIDSNELKKNYHKYYKTKRNKLFKLLIKDINGQLVKNGLKESSTIKINMYNYNGHSKHKFANEICDYVVWNKVKPLMNEKYNVNKFKYCDSRLTIDYTFKHQEVSVSHDASQSDDPDSYVNN